MKSTSEDIALLISAINSLIVSHSNIRNNLSIRKDSLESALHSFNQLSLFTRFHYRKYLSQRIDEIKKELECIKIDKTCNEQSLRTNLLILIRKLLLAYSNEKYAITKKQRNAAWENLSEWLAMEHETFIRYTNQCGCVV